MTPISVFIEVASMSSQSSGSTIRLIVLIAILGLVGFAFYNDTMNRKPAVDKLTDDFFALQDSEDGPLSSKSFQEKVKLSPDRSFKVGKYDVEEYKLRRTIPFLSFGSMYAIYEKGELFKVAQGAEPTVESIEKASGFDTFEQKEKTAEVSLAGMGSPPPNLDDKEGGKGAAKKDVKEEEKKEEAPAPEKKGAEVEKKADDQSKPGDGG
jgi:hypothetical protein